MRRVWGWLIVVVLVVVAGVAASRYDWWRQSRVDNPAGIRTTSPPRESQAGKNDTASDNQASPTTSNPTEGSRAREITSTVQPVTVTEEQRNKLRDYVQAHPDVKVDTVDFTISVGAGVPRQITLHDLPLELADTLRGYQGDLFVVVRDQMVIVDRNARRVVAIISEVS